jgi:16S rRNA (adenine1518-N6/adenine1519-N6)-dimethyltransferase
VRAAAFARGRVLFDLPPGAFRPSPRVTSSVLELVPLTGPVDRAGRDRALAIASLAFRFRRKTVANALSSAVDRARVTRALEELGRSPMARAEELSLADYVALAARIGAA